MRQTRKRVKIKNMRKTKKGRNFRKTRRKRGGMPPPTQFQKSVTGKITVVFTETPADRFLFYNDPLSINAQKIVNDQIGEIKNALDPIVENTIGIIKEGTKQTINNAVEKANKDITPSHIENAHFSNK